jgi:hypothetical protein
MAILYLLSGVFFACRYDCSATPLLTYASISTFNPPYQALFCAFLQRFKGPMALWSVPLYYFVIGAFGDFIQVHSPSSEISILFTSFLLTDPFMTDCIVYSSSFALSAISALFGLRLLADTQAPSLWTGLALILITIAVTIRVEFAAFYVPALSSLVNIARVRNIAHIWILGGLIGAIGLYFWTSPIAVPQITGDAEYAGRELRKVALEVDKTGLYTYLADIPIGLVVLLLPTGKSGERQFIVSLVLAMLFCWFSPIVSGGDREYPQVAVFRLLLYATLGWTLMRLKPVHGWIALLAIVGLAFVSRVMSMGILAGLGSDAAD